MESFILRYLNEKITNEEIKKHGITRLDLEYIKKKYEELDNMLEQYHLSIFDKKEQSEKIKEEIEINTRIANLFSFLGQSYQYYLSSIQSTMDGNEGPSLEDSLSRNNQKTLNFIIYLLSRQQQNYVLLNLYHNGYYSGCPIKYKVNANVDLLVNEDEPFLKSSYRYDARNYINRLYENGKSFIITSKDTYCDDNTFEILYQDNKLLLNSENVGFLGRLGYKTICFLGDDIFRNTMTKLLLYSQQHGFNIEDINTKLQQKAYAQAIESMDITEYSIKKNYQKTFSLEKLRS